MSLPQVTDDEKKQVFQIHFVVTTSWQIVHKKIIKDLLWLIPDSLCW